MLGVDSLVAESLASMETIFVCKYVISKRPDDPGSNPGPRIY